MAKQTLAIIDGKSVFYRGYFGLPNLATGDGRPTSGVYGFTMMALKVLKDFKPDYVIVAWDKSKTNIRARRKLYPAYKANRKPMPEDLREQIPILRQVLEAFHWPLIETDDFEADDIMATLSRQASQKDLKTVLVTSDLDILQAVHGDVEVCALKRGLTHVVRYTPAKFTEEYGLTPDQFIDYKALKGDASDNVPGVAGIGDKTARQLIQQYGSLDGVYKNLDQLPATARAKLEVGKDMAYLSHKLLEIRFDVPVKLDLKAAAIKQANPQAITKLFDELQFRRLLTELPPYMQGAVDEATEVRPAKNLPVVKVIEINDAKDLKVIKAGAQTVLHTISVPDTKSRLPQAQKIIISPDPHQAYLINNPELIPLLVLLLSKTTVIGHDLKTDLKSWRWFEPTDLFDTMLAAFIVDPLFPQPKLAELARKDLGADLVLADPTAPQAGLIAAAVWQLYERYRKALKAEPSLQKVAEQLDFPLVPVLAKMEATGVKLDVTYLKKMSKQLEKRINKIRDLIYDEAKEQFNIGSPQQLAKVLFETLQLPTTGIKKLKTGYSTAAPELEKLRGLHPIVSLIGEYRELTKLKGTYVDALPELVDSNSRLHTSFDQAVAQTGRLSSSNPNLQNIPIRTEVGREIRQAFVADPGNVLISADYSQNELRMAAVLANDKNMIHAFNKGIDIHAMTAAEVNDLDDIEMVTAEQRRAAKTVNFGILYGLSTHGLSAATGMSYEAAKSFIDRYFETRGPLLKYLESLKAKAKTDGYVETLFGRRRPMPDIKSSNWVVRAAAERAAINAPIQGSAADITKLAMIKVDKKLDDDTRILLQLHDSLLVEVPEAKAKAVAKLLKTTMENVYKLPVKLDVDVKIGSHWGEL